VRPDGLVKVLDFGIAPQAMKRDGETRTPSNIETAPGLVMGTPRYMSPEQARGLPLDSRTDLFSLGAVLYEVLAGRPAFDGDTFSDILASVLTHDPLPLKALGPQCPPAVARIVDRAKGCHPALPVSGRNGFQPPGRPATHRRSAVDTG
jgi:eukaryotic-like serine/threonine-protein kinase